VILAGVQHFGVDTDLTWWMSQATPTSSANVTLAWPIHVASARSCSTIGIARRQRVPFGPRFRQRRHDSRPPSCPSGRGSPSRMKGSSERDLSDPGAPAPLRPARRGPPVTGHGLLLRRTEAPDRIQLLIHRISVQALNKSGSIVGQTRSSIDQLEGKPAERGSLFRKTDRGSRT
jgi:hypothetical protein